MATTIQKTQAEIDEENRRRLGGGASTTSAPTTPTPRPEPIKTAAEIQSSLPGLTVGQQTRGAGAVRLDQQTAPAGKELIGMKSGVPIYADAKDIYGAPSSASPTVAPKDTTKGFGSTVLSPMERQMTATQTAPSKSLQQMRDEYQTGVTASAVRAQAAPASEQKRFGTATREDFDRAQAEARQRAMERLAYPRQDKPTSTTETVNAASAALKRAAAEPKVASMEEVQRTGAALGFPPAKTKQLGFGVGDQGESLAVTPDYLKRLRQRAGLNY